MLLEPPIKPVDFLSALKRNRHNVLICIIACTVLSAVAYRVIPKRYKVSSSISLETKYFQVPLVSGFLPDTLDPQELRAQREALIRRALDHKFLSEIAIRYNLLDDPRKASVGPYELELVRKRFEIIPVGSSAFTINLIARDPTQGYQAIQVFFTRLRTLMTEERRTHLLNLHDAIQEQLESLTFGKERDGSSVIFAGRPDLIQYRLRKVKDEIAALKISYNETHPRIAELNRQLSQLEAWSKPATESPVHSGAGDAFSGVKVDDSAKVLFDDLLTKYRYLEVVIHMDQQNKNQYLTFLSEPHVPPFPIWPRLPVLLAWGIAAGFLVGSGFVFLRELSARANPITKQPREYLASG